MIEISGFGTEWVLPLRDKLAALGSQANTNLWIVSGEPNGTVGMVNCLKLEENGKKVR